MKHNPHAQVVLFKGQEEIDGRWLNSAVGYTQEPEVYFNKGTVKRAWLKGRVQKNVVKKGES